ncbi:MAG TPA: arylsulfotransferase family protein [Solirubrobacteraceae bacterium]|nr:arylsulfotransferase family protein [Solirubrobacteraceae bacterium]
MFAAKLLAALGAAAVALANAAAAAPAASAAVAVYPSPRTSNALPQTQITFRGVTPQAIGLVVVKGSSTGAHTGHIEGDSDGQGGSFLVDKPFAKGETVTVNTGLSIIGGSGGTFAFKVGNPAFAINAMPLPVVPAGANGVMRFRSRPDLTPGSVTISKNSAPSSQGDIFLTPQFGPLQNGPMIIDSRGNLVWFHPAPVSQQTIASDFRVQRYNGAPVLTWFEGITNHGSGRGQGVIFDQKYVQIATVHAGNGLDMDLHEFLISGGSAWIAAVQPSSVPGVGKPTMDDVIQEIDIKTGLVMFEWHALDHIATGDTYFPPRSAGFVFDPYHTNTVEPLKDGTVLISMRNTSAVYKIDPNTGRVLWTLGGKHSSFKFGSGASFAFQHTVLQQPDGTLTVFDDGGGPPYPHSRSRGIRLSLDTRHMRANLAKEYDHAPNIQANFEGGVQDLSGGDVFLGWGQQPYFSEDNASGQQIFDGRFTVPTSSYRAYRFAWSAQPPTQPALAVGAAGDGTSRLYASWNGATDVASWQVMAGSIPNALVPLGSTRNAGFETAIDANSNAPYFAVRALSASGRVLASSPVAATPAHVAVYGHSAFVSPQGTGAVPASCAANHPCSVDTTITAGRTVVATAGRERLAAASGGLLFFRLNQAGRSLLNKASNRRLGVQVSIHDASGTRGTAGMDLIKFSAGGAGPKRSVVQSPKLQLIGLTDFVNSKGTGGILAGCFAAAPCRVTTTVSVGRTVIARTGREYLGPSTLGYLFFQLNGTGQSMLAHASGNQLGAQVGLSSSQGTASGQVALVGFS